MKDRTLARCASLCLLLMALLLPHKLPTCKANLSHPRRLVESKFPMSSLKKKSQRLGPLLSIRGGEKGTTDQNAVEQVKTSLDQSLTVVQLSSFLVVVSFIITTFSPAPALIDMIGTTRATSLLSALVSSAAVCEILFSPAIGRILDSTGRKIPFLLTVLAMALTSGVVVFNHSVLAICAAKFTGHFCLGLIYQTITQVMICDVAASSTPERMGSELALQGAIIGGGFIFGAIAAGQLSNSGLSVIYGLSSILLLFTVVLTVLCMPETLSPSKRVPFEAHIIRKQIIQAPISCMSILIHRGMKLRMLAVLLMLQLFPSFIGDFFQIFSQSEWNIGTREFSTYVAIGGMLGIIGNISSGAIIPIIGTRRFTSIAALSAICQPIGASFFSYPGALVGMIIGFLATAQYIGVLAAIATEGEKRGVLQGELAGERASLTALLKAVGPIMYSTMYIKGKQLVGLGNLPFLFNICLAIAAFVLTQIHL
mmetsp:Transcript_7430/g.11174  ORF Transcript_7430/g.11174 Transcript_7430/m.11174 type:complete len:482 (-) Transcript_7430:314-1759(-)